MRTVTTGVTVAVVSGLVLTLGGGAAVATAGPAPTASTVTRQGTLPLDLPLTNRDGELAGGVHPDLPTDVATLTALLDQARAEDVEPRRYTALLWQYWLARATTDAGIDLGAWDPARGVHENDPTSMAVYRYYGKLYLDHPDLHWMGMANLVGATFAAGFQDLAPLGDLGRLIQGRIAELPPEVRPLLPSYVRDLAAQDTQPVAEELQWFEWKFLSMQKHIFMDQAATHLAYLTGGVPAVEEMHAAGLLDDRALTAWRDIASGDPERVEAGNAALEFREQNQTIADQWTQMRTHGGPLGELMTYGMTTVGSVTIPGTRTPARYRPLTVSGDVPVGGTTTHVRLSTPLPSFNVADNGARWTYITGDTLPVYQRLIRDDPLQLRLIVATPIETRVAQQRIHLRWPQLALDLTTNWRLELGTGTPG